MDLTVAVVDAHTGRPAMQLPVVLERQESDGWCVLVDQETDQQGKVRYKAPVDDLSIHRCVVNTERYFAALGTVSSYSDIVVTLRGFSSNRTVSVLIAARAYLVSDIES